MPRKPLPNPETAPSAPLPGWGTAEAVLQRLEWTVLRRLDGLLEGDYRSLFRGLGLDLADLRPYQFNDDVRHIDWNVTARVLEPHVRQFQQEREITAWFLLDLSASMEFGAYERSKRDVLLTFVGAFSRLLTRHGNRVGAIVADQGVEMVLPARGGRQQVLQLLHRLMRREPSRGGTPAGRRATDLAALLRHAAGVMRRRAMVFLVSDFICEPGWTEPLGQLAQRRDVLAVRLVDPLERELPDLGLIPMQDAETGEQLWVDTHDPAFRRRFAAVARQREAELRIAFGDAGVDALELSTDEDLTDALRRFIALRKLRARLAAGGGVPAPRTGQADVSADGGQDVVPVA
ncbi:DUF58 domain-containing protein [Caldimonas thermodepolymerans]|uniref:DUF58 domain-containing protein n=1 Tax=Caldimonas thermodepolymerans TaxID=215580 RepID=A0A2S5T373_9BURK|nr:DUF58 domain-containing protein [Caldimonas thermodepolymerans]PPE69348.1 DUF58 domain-containing protein [Caldimonas thermodepolymerans]QPC31076.1 DUF58 domain-containing protein [Caldimonas thermodepolymerans]RDH96196.1 uncharacterized protein DUF58 [Caldimonas thermodepolymerans]